MAPDNQGVQVGHVEGMMRFVVARSAFRDEAIQASTLGYLKK